MFLFNKRAFSEIRISAFKNTKSFCISTENPYLYLVKRFKFVTIMALFTLFGHSRAAIPAYPTDTIVARDGRELTFTFFKHAAFTISAGEGRTIYIDPVHTYADYARLPKADLILVTHSHYDHLDRKAIDTLATRTTDIVCDRTSAESFDTNCHVMRPGSIVAPRDWVRIEAVAAYNTTQGHLQFHPKEREDCGYIVTIGGTRIYIAGDTEPTPELLALRNIDIAFLPVNQPYTMTVEQAVQAVKAIRPTIFYPYHYGEVEQPTDLEALTAALEKVTEVRIRPME